MSSKGNILVIGSSADTFELKDGRREPVGYYLNEMVIPMQAAVDAGYEIVPAPRSIRSVIDEGLDDYVGVFTAHTV